MYQANQTAGENSTGPSFSTTQNELKANGLKA